MLGATERETLLDLADAALVAGLEGWRLAPVSLADLPPALHEPVGAFVTLTVAGALNGCIGSIEGVEPLGHAVPRLAWSSAFEDPRLPALHPDDYPRLAIEISVLSALTPMPAATRDELLAILRPGIDGLVLGTGHRRAVFLPKVWEQLPDPDAFVDHLLLKAGLRPGVWAPSMAARRFTTETFGRAAGTTGEPSRAA